MAIATNGIKDFKNAIFYHRRALELDNSLADLCRKNSKYRYTYKEKIVPCIGCGHNTYEIFNVTNQSIAEDNKELINPLRVWVRCKNCNLIYANPLPDEDVLNEYYSLIAKEKFGGIYGDINKRFEFLIKISNKRLDRIEKYISPKGSSLLDIGAGIGVFVGSALDRGWKAEGVELTAEDCKYAKENFNISLIQKDFYNLQNSKVYDVVTLFEVIEHLRTPLKALRKVYTLLKDDGLLVLATPIQDSLYGIKTKEHNIFWNVVAHLSYFTKNVLIKYLDMVGFEVVGINYSDEGMGRMEFYCKKVSKDYHNKVNSINFKKTININTGREDNFYKCKYNTFNLNLNPSRSKMYDTLHNLANPCFVLSTGRCGTMLLAKILNSSPNIAAQHEPTPELIYYAKFAYEHQDIMPDILKMIIDSARLEYIMYAHINKKLYFEANNRITFFAPQLAELYPKSKFIHLIRNPADFVRSGMRRNYYENDNQLWEMGRIVPKEGLNIPWGEMEQLAKIAWLWNETNLFIENFKQKIDKTRVITIRSDDLFIDSKIVEDIFRFININCHLSREQISNFLQKKVNSQKTSSFPKYEMWDKKQKETLKKYATLALKYGFKL